MSASRFAEETPISALTPHRDESSNSHQEPGNHSAVVNQPVIRTQIDDLYRPTVGTALVFPSSPLDTLSLQAINAGAAVENLSLYPLHKTMDRSTAM